MIHSKHSFLRDIWYYALPSHQLKPGQTIAKTLLNEPILFGRSSDGKAFALRDMCPHRAVPLSEGCFDGQKVECFFHGWKFDTTGQCTTIPSLTDDQQIDLNPFQIRTYQLQEVQGSIWIYMSSTERVSSPQINAPQVPSFGDYSYQPVMTMRFPCHVDQVIFGFLDMAHVPFIHRSWWWRPKKVKSLSSQGKAFVPSLYGFTRCRHTGSEQNFFYRLIGSMPEVERQFQLPGIRVERFTTAKHTACSLTIATPITETETEVTVLFYTTLPWFPLLKPVLLPFMQAFLNQDREAVVKQQMRLKYNPPLSLIKDADTQVLWYYQLKAEFARAIAENRPFVNPIKAQVLHWRTH